MCRGIPRTHPCSHGSISWHFCPSAFIDLDSGVETPCSNISYANTRDTKANCPLQHCHFKEKGPNWTCCACLQGPNEHGWCNKLLGRVRLNPQSLVLEPVSETCDHCCCPNCAPYPHAVATIDAGAGMDYASSPNLSDASVEFSARLPRQASRRPRSSKKRGDGKSGR